MLSGFEYLSAFPRVNRILLRRGYVMFLYVPSHDVPNSFARKQHKMRINALEYSVCTLDQYKPIILYDTTYFDHFLLAAIRCSRWDIFFARSSRSRWSTLRRSCRLAISVLVSRSG